jgi:hypothetical protein
MTQLETLQENIGSASDLGATDQTRWSLLHARHADLCRLKTLCALGCHQEARTLAQHLDLEDQAEQWGQSYGL